MSVDKIVPLHGTVSPSGDDFDGDDRPEILIRAGQLADVVNEAETALLASRSNLYQRSGSIVRPTYLVVDISDGRKTKILRPVEVSTHHITECLTSAAIFKSYDMRAKQWVVKDCPAKISETYVARVGLWQLPHLIGIMTTPTLRADGSILERPGYDPRTGLLFDPQGKRFPPIPDNPTQEDAYESLRELKALLSTFPFTTSAGRSVALSSILTAMIRRSLNAAPIHCFSAPTAGSGKSKLADIASIIATGKECPCISQGQDEIETEKRLGSQFIAGAQVISIDNCSTPLAGDLLCQLLTQPVVSIRVLGLSKSIDIMPNAMMFATGNNLKIEGDLTRRSLVGTVDHGVERPELLQFEGDVIENAFSGYAAYAVHALTILRAFHCAGYPRQKPVLGSFELWSKRVRDALVWLGETDPVETMEAARGSDPRLTEISSVFAQWDEVIGSKRVSVRQVIEAAVIKRNVHDGQNQFEDFSNPSFRDALLVVADDKKSISARKLGYWLSVHKERVVDGLKIIQEGISHGVSYWSLQHVEIQ